VPRLLLLTYALLVNSENSDVSLQLNPVIDRYDPGMFNPEDQITLTSPTLGLSGPYTVKRIQRDLTDPNLATVDFERRLRQDWELNERFRRMLNDLSAGVPIA
jgi:hypothetical protein